MRVLLTNWRLEQRAGSELYLLDVARWLRDHGHVPVAYSARQGPFVDEIRRESIAVVDDPRLMAEPPDVIHGQHHLATMTAIARFPEVPVVAFCHGWEPFEEMPVRHPSIRRYVAVSGPTRERLVLESGIDPALVSVVPNFVDTDRFKVRQQPLPDRPRRALMFSNYAAAHLRWAQTLAAACAAQGIVLDFAGKGSGRPAAVPEELLLDYDLVFAKGRASIEAMASGAAVVLCDFRGLGPMVSTRGFDRLLDGNFGMRVLQSEHSQALFEAAISDYDPADAQAVTQLVRTRLARDVVVPDLLRIYGEAIEDAARSPTDQSDAYVALADYLHALNQLDPVPSEAIHKHYGALLKEAHAALERMEADHQALGEANSALAHGRSQLAAAESRATALADLLNAANGQRGVLGRRVTALEREQAALTAELESMRRSTSWLATRPLRSLGASVRKATSRNRAR